jgi:hypothetical protein
MTKSEITELARKAGFEVSEITGSIRSPSPLCGTELKRFAKLVAAAEREACAVVSLRPPEPTIFFSENISHAQFMEQFEEKDQA